MKINQEVKKNTWGGKRVGSGRIIGVSNKFKIADKLDDGQRTELVEKAFSLAKKGDSRMIAYLLDQLCGKARQNIGLDGGESEKPIDIILNIIENANRQTISQQRLQDK